MTLPQFLQELEEKARAATPGPWGTEPGTYGHRITYQDSNYDYPSEKWTAYLGTRDKLSDSYNQWQRDATFIAAANPDTVLRLIEIVRVQQEALEFVAAESVSLEKLASLGDEVYNDTLKAREALSEAQRIAGGKEG